MNGKVIKVGDEEWCDTNDSRGIWRYDKKHHGMRKKKMSRDKAKTIERDKRRKQKRANFG